MKSFIIIVLILIALSALVLKQDSHNSILRRLNSEINGDLYPFITYDYNATIKSRQFADTDHQSDENINVNITANCQILIYHSTKQHYLVYFFFNTFNVIHMQMENGEPISNQSYVFEDNRLDQIFYDIVLNDKQYQVENVLVINTINKNYSEFMQYVAQDIVKLAYPQIQGYGDEIRSATENDNMGTVIPHYQKLDSENGQTVLKKWYNQNDFVSMKYEIGPQRPEINYELVTTYDSASQHVKKSAESNRFVAANNVQYKTKVKQDGEYETQPIVVQNVDVQQTSQITFIKVEYNYDLFQEVQSYVEKAPTEKVNVTKWGEAIVYTYSDSENQPNSHPNETPVFTNSYQVVQMTMMSQQFGIRADYNNYGLSSQVQANVYVNNKFIMTLYDFTYENCPGSKKDNDERYNKTIKLFKVTWPVLEILSLQFQASLELDWGYRWFYGPSDLKTGCLLQFMPYFFAQLEAQGDISIAVAKAGMYSTGEIAHTSLIFEIELKDAIVETSKKIGGEFNIRLTILPFSYDFGAFYNLLKCKWLRGGTFSWKLSCQWGDTHKISLGKGEVFSVIDKLLFHREYYVPVQIEDGSEASHRIRNALPE